MAALDYLKEFENRALDAATYGLLKRNFELLESNNRILTEQVGLLEKDNARLTTENDSLKEEIAELEAKLEEFSPADEANVIERGIAFHRKPDGSFDETPYCPSCDAVLSNPVSGVYVCSDCKYSKSDVDAADIVMKLNAKRP